mmetsp:Transcript_75437/g.125315  ORF Transcript_75437/g.125315 Transcript_75437/m.125315 type:complete len:83 (+) Transcript_75437:44-292(+)
MATITGSRPRPASPAPLAAAVAASEVATSFEVQAALQEGAKLSRSAVIEGAATAGGLGHTTERHRDITCRSSNAARRLCRVA